MNALTPLAAIAAVVVCIAGAAKLRSPGPTARALGELSLPPSIAAVRLMAGLEIALGIAAALAGGRWLDLCMAVLYLAFAAVAARLVALRASCGCFGQSGDPTSALAPGLNLALAALAGAAAAASAPGLNTLVHVSPLQALTLVAGVAGSAYAAVIAYVELPNAWAAWSAR